MHKHSVTFKAEVEFFVKKADKSFGVEIRKDGNLVTKLYGSLNRNVYRQDFSIADLIDKKGKVTFKKIGKTSAKAEKEVITKRGRSNIKGSVDTLAKNIAEAFASYVK